MGVDGENVTGVLHGRVELQARYGLDPDVDEVQWNKYSAKNSTKKVIYLIKTNNTTCIAPCKNIDLQNMSLILFNLTQEDEGIYEEKTSFKNKTVKYFNITLSLQVLGPESPPRFSTTVSSTSHDFSAQECEIE
ncbi:hepatocyte cell adhesion molecule-like, partial [Clarias magur]